jgi:toxin YhaV
MIVNKWNLRYFSIFKTQLDQLVHRVTEIKAKDPTNFQSHNDTKLLTAIYKAIRIEVPSNPNHRIYLLGATLGEKHKDWRRVKHLLPPRYRLFFRFLSTSKDIIYVWFNDENTLRKAGAATDVYNVFRTMLNSGKVPTKFNDLKTQSSQVEEIKN